MVLFNEVVQWPLNRIKCSDIVHCSRKSSCFESLIWSLYCNHKSAAKYYAPLLVGPILLKYRSINRVILMNAAVHYIQTTSFAASINAFTFFFVCLTRKLCGRFIWILTPFVPTVIGAQLCWWLPKQVLDFYMTGVTSSALECYFRQSNNLVTRLIRTSQLSQTLIFMICSAIILHFKKIGSYQGFWFITPAYSLGKNKLTFIYSGLKKYVFLGIILDLMNNIIKIRLRDDIRTITEIFEFYKANIRFKSTSFFAAYIGFYRFACCTLAIFDQMIPMSIINIASALIGGSAFILLDDVAFVCFAMVITTRILWNHFCNDVNSIENLNRKICILKKLAKIPFSRIFLPFEIAYLVHNYFYNNHFINKLMKSLINATSANKTQRIYNLVNEADNHALKLLLKSKETPFF